MKRYSIAPSATPASVRVRDDADHPDVVAQRVTESETVTANKFRVPRTATFDWPITAETGGK